MRELNKDMLILKDLNVYGILILLNCNNKEWGKQFVKIQEKQGRKYEKPLINWGKWEIWLHQSNNDDTISTDYEGIKNFSFEPCKVICSLLHLLTH